MLFSDRSPLGSARLYAENAVKAQVGRKSGAAQARRHFLLQVSPARRLVRRSGVVEQLTAALEHPGQLVIKQLRIEFAGDAESRRVMQYGIDRLVLVLRYRLR